MAGRLFNEKEVSEILKRASSIRASGGLADPGGISLEELQQTGAELGFDPAHIEQAAEQLGTRASSSTGFLGPRIVLDRTVEGELTDDDWLGMVAAIQRYHKDAGAVTQRAGNYDWAGSEEGRSLALTVNVRNRRSRIRLESNCWTGPFVTSVVCFTLAFAFSAKVIQHGSPLAALPIWLILIAAWFGLLRMFHYNHAQSVAGLLERLVAEVGSAGTVQPELTSTHGLSETADEQQSVQA